MESSSVAADTMGNQDVYRAVFLSDGNASLLLQGGKILDCNPRGLALLECGHDDAVGRPPHFFSPDLQPDGSDSAEGFQEKIAEAFENGGLVFPWRLRTEPGKEFGAEVTLVPLESQGEPLALARIRKLAEPPSNHFDLAMGGTLPGHVFTLDSLSLMAGGLAHDFNNYLLAIIGNADLLDRDLAAGRSGGELLGEIRKAAGRAADLCKQLLSYAGKGQSRFQPVDLSLTAQEMVQMLKVAISRRIALRLELGAELPMIEGDLSQVHQVIMNLVVNASEAIGNRPGTITLATGVTHCQEKNRQCCLLKSEMLDGQLVYLEVRDDGEGMDEEVQRRIFDPYFSTKIRGRGLGLATVLGTVRTHQGSLCVRSTPQQGTSIRVCFPAAHLNRTVQSGEAIIRQFEPLGHGAVLIVDDEEYLRVLCSRMLQRLGYNVLLAADGHQALAVYDEHRDGIAGVILDLVMPVMDGVEVLEKLRRLDPEVKIIMTSGYHEKELAARLAGRGIAGFLQKPYVMSDLGKVLGQVVGPRV